MIWATTVCLVLLGQVLPGSDLSLDQAQERSRTIWVGQPISYPLIAGAGACKATNAELKPSIVLKGRIEGEDWAKVSMQAVSREDFPVVHQDFIFFTDKYDGHNNVVKVLPNTLDNLAAVRYAINPADKDEVVFLGSRLTLEEAVKQSGVITAGKIVVDPLKNESGQLQLGRSDIHFSETWRGSEAIKVCIQQLSLQAFGREVLPQAGENYFLFIGRVGGCKTSFGSVGGHDAIVKVLPATAENREAIEQTFQKIPLPGSDLSIEQAKAEAHTIVIARLAPRSIFVGDNGGIYGTGNFDLSETLKGEAKQGNLKNMSYKAIREETLPQTGRSYILFIAKSPVITDRDDDRVIKLLPVTDGNTKSVQLAHPPATDDVAPPKAITAARSRSN